MESKIYSVKEVTGYIKKLLARDENLNDLWIVGEISNFHHHNSGHMYFSLKDKSARIKCIMFKGYNSRLKFTPEDGLKVTAHGCIDVYAPRGNYQFNVDKLEPEGKGALYLAFEQLKKKLEDEGLFAEKNKKQIPLLPERIGIVTSPTGAALRDILSVVDRRFNNVSLLIVPSLVQGAQASNQLVQGIKYLDNNDDIDVIIVSRGGGSIEDLWPFNEEIVARAIYNSKTPVISGVGHETDFTITDFVSDLRAPTPSAAAEMAIARRLDLEQNLDNLYSRLSSSIKNLICNYREKLKSFSNKRIFRTPSDLFAEQIQRVDDLSRRLQWSLEKTYSHKKEKANILGSKLDTLSPLKTLKRGYSISTHQQGHVIRKINEVNQGETMITRVTDGILYSQVEDIEEDGDINGR